MSGRIERQWSEYLRVLPRQASSVQVMESKRAFFAGANALLSEIVTMLDPGLEPTEGDLKKMDEIAAELNDFVGRVKAGQA